MISSEQRPQQARHFRYLGFQMRPDWLRKRGLGQRLTAPARWPFLAVGTNSMMICSLFRPGMYVKRCTSHQRQSQRLHPRRLGCLPRHRLPQRREDRLARRRPPPFAFEITGRSRGRENVIAISVENVLKPERVLWQHARLDMSMFILHQDHVRFLPVPASTARSCSTRSHRPTSRRRCRHDHRAGQVISPPLSAVVDGRFRAVIDGRPTGSRIDDRDGVAETVLTVLTHLWSGTPTFTI